MEKPILLIMAAGLGSRYGGLKQIDPVDDKGQIIIDYSIYDALKAGFKKVVFIINRQNESDFREVIGDRVSKFMDVEYVFQDIYDIPDGIDFPEDRVKPWGTAHAIYAARDHIKGPFAVINSDDFYGESSFKQIYDFLDDNRDDDKFNYAMVAYILQNTITENGYVSRGVCSVDEGGYLSDLVERTRIEKFEDGIKFSTDDGKSWTQIDENSLVSMNLWGFTRSFVDEIEKGMGDFLKENLKSNPLKCEYYIPYVVNELLKAKRARVRVLESQDKWYGVTYKEDKEGVVDAIRNMKRSGKYPDVLWK